MGLANSLWEVVAAIVTTKKITTLLRKRGLKNPYLHIVAPQTGEIYMERYWIFNPYNKQRNWFQKMFPSVRLHRIMVPDRDRHMHDHPWNARTIILDGWYIEQKEGSDKMYFNDAGVTNPIRFGEYHRIDEVSPGGVWTLFITWKYQGTWGFNVDGKKIPYNEYLNKEIN